MPLHDDISQYFLALHFVYIICPPPPPHSVAFVPNFSVSFSFLVNKITQKKNFEIIQLSHFQNHLKCAQIDRNPMLVCIARVLAILYKRHYYSISLGPFRFCSQLG